MAWHNSEVNAESMKLSIPFHIAQVLYPVKDLVSRGNYLVVTVSCSIFACRQLHILTSVFNYWKIAKSQD